MDANVLLRMNDLLRHISIKYVKIVSTVEVSIHLGRRECANKYQVQKQKAA